MTLQEKGCLILLSKQICIRWKHVADFSLAKYYSFAKFIKFSSCQELSCIYQNLISSTFVSLTTSFIIQTISGRQEKYT